ncbi:hypothetical protein C8J56DRAFT_1131763 [Mycena floridula]|nr:hypothetical protein C8J56DRAFT_1131763 [Mycena floridula]
MSSIIFFFTPFSFLASSLWLLSSLLLFLGILNLNDYIGEVHQFVNADSGITNKSMLIVPSVSGNGAFTEQNVFDAGYTDTDIMSTISHLAVEHYQDNNRAQTTRRFADVDALRFVFNTLFLQDVEAAFYQIARGLVLPLTITVVALTSRTPPAKSVVLYAFVVTVGFLLGVAWPTADVPTTSMPGPLAPTYGVLSSLSIAIHVVLIKSSLTDVGGSPTQLSYWANFGAAAFLGVLALLMQTFDGVYESDARLKGDIDVKAVTAMMVGTMSSMAPISLASEADAVTTVEASILATSNGYQGFTEGEGNGGSTSRRSGTNEGCGGVDEPHSDHRLRFGYCCNVLELTDSVDT